jgi:hypothetical protein
MSYNNSEKHRLSLRKQLTWLFIPVMARVGTAACRAFIRLTKSMCKEQHIEKGFN